MGQYLMIGIATRILISKERAKRQTSATPEEIEKALQEQYNQSGIYVVEHYKDAVCLELDPAIAEQEWTDFLEDFYKLRYSKDRLAQLVDMEDIRERKTLKEWIDFAEEKPYQAYQMDRYGWFTTRFPRGWTNSLETRMDMITLSMDGKILMECYSELFDFFNLLIREKLSKYRLSNSIMVYISG